MGGIAEDQGEEAGKESTWVLPPRISLYDTLHREGGGQVQKQKLFSKGERSPPRKGGSLFPQHSSAVSTRDIRGDL